MPNLSQTRILNNRMILFLIKKLLIPRQVFDDFCFACGFMKWLRNDTFQKK